MYINGRPSPDRRATDASPLSSLCPSSSPLLFRSTLFFFVTLYSFVPFDPLRLFFILLYLSFLCSLCLLSTIAVAADVHISYALSIIPVCPPRINLLTRTELSVSRFWQRDHALSSGFILVRFVVRGRARSERAAIKTTHRSRRCKARPAAILPCSGIAGRAVSTVQGRYPLMVPTLARRARRSSAYLDSEADRWVGRLCRVRQAGDFQGLILEVHGRSR